MIELDPNDEVLDKWGNCPSCSAEGCMFPQNHFNAALNKAAELMRDKLDGACCVGSDNAAEMILALKDKS